MQDECWLSGRLRWLEKVRTFVCMDDFSLTANQRRVFDCVRRYLDQHQRPPTLREISETLGLSSHSSAQDYVEALIRKGALERLPHHRGLRLAQRSRAPAAASLPLVGRVAAGSPIMSDANIETNYAVDPGLFRPRADFLLRVVGMKNDARVNLKIEEPEGSMRPQRPMMNGGMNGNMNGGMGGGHAHEPRNPDDYGTMADIQPREPKAAPAMRDLDDVLGDLKV